MRHNAVMTETFTCDSCGDTLPKGWTDEEAAAEAEELFPGINVSDPAEAGIVCDACYQHIMGRVHAEAPELIGEGWRGLMPRSASPPPGPFGECYAMASGTMVHVRPGCRCKS